MLLPSAWLRKRWLQRAMRDYPLYDPPHKVEERLLTREQAAENFDYFMRVPTGDPYKLRTGLSPKEHLELIDSHAEDED